MDIKQFAFYTPIVVGGVVALFGSVELLAEAYDWLLKVPTCEYRPEEVCEYVANKRDIARGLAMLTGGKLFAWSSILGRRFLGLYA